jgi:imidazolonepropionase-like amidohydrolase
MTARRLLVSLPLLLAASLLGPGAPVARAETVVLRGGRVIPVDAPEIEDGVVLVRDGRIAAVGSRAAVQVPYDATVIDTSGKVVFPGFVLAHTSVGMDRANESLPVTPFVDVADGIDPSSLAYEDALRDGVTTLLVVPADDTLIGGLGRVIRPMGLTQDEMTVKPGPMKLSVGGKRGWDRIRERAKLREAFAELEDYVEGVAERRYAEEEKAAGREVTVSVEKARELGKPLVRAEDLDDVHRNLWLLTQGKLDAIVSCAAAQDVDYAIAMALEEGFLERTTFVLAGDAWKAAAVLKEAGRPVVCEDLVVREDDPITGEEKETFVPGVLLAAGIDPSLVVDPDTTFAGRFLWYQAARCVREGVARDVALKTVTLYPARAIGVEARKGSISPGKDGDLLILSGDPLSARTQVETVLLEGKVVYERARDHRLRRLITGEDERPTAPASDGPGAAPDTREPPRPGRGGRGAQGSRGAR